VGCIEAREVGESQKNQSAGTHLPSKLAAKRATQGKNGISGENPTNCERSISTDPIHPGKKGETSFRQPLAAFTGAHKEKKKRGLRWGRARVPDYRRNLGGVVSGRKA